MKSVRMALAVVIGLAIWLSLGNSVVAQQKQETSLIVVANDINYELAQPWVTFMKSENIPFKRIQPSEFEQYKKEKYIAILGGPNDADETGSIVKQILAKEEFEWVSQPGNGKMYLKNDIWNNGQNILVFAGPTKEASARARTNSREKWIGYLSKWFDIELSAEAVYGY